jgi:serine protease Do
MVQVAWLSGRCNNQDTVCASSRGIVYAGIATLIGESDMASFLKSKTHRALGLLALSLGLFSAQVQAQTTLGQPPAATPDPAAAPAATGISKYQSAIVQVAALVPREAQSVATLGARRSGSGVIIGERLVLTIGYLLLEADQVAVISASGKRIPGAVAGYDHATGFGLVRTALPVDGLALPLGDSDQLKERQKVLTQGHGEAEATELMVLSRKPFAGSWEYLLEKPIYTFPPVNNWSGSALIAEDGSLVGIGSLILNDAADQPRGVPGNLFVPVNLLKPILDELLAGGRRKSNVQPWLGMTTEVVRGNLMVVRVSKDGPADAAGVEPGDIVMGVGPERVTDQADFYRRLWQAGPAGSTVALRLLKGGQVRDVPVKSIDRMDFLRKPSGV